VQTRAQGVAKIFGGQVSENKTIREDETRLVSNPGNLKRYEGVSIKNETKLTPNRGMFK
jgi:hypothetical protein